MGSNPISFQFLLSEKRNRNLSLQWWCRGLRLWQFSIYFHFLHISKESRNYVFSLCCIAQFLENNLLWRIQFYLFFSWGVYLLDKRFRHECVIKFHLTFRKCFHIHPFWFVLIEKVKLRNQNSSSRIKVLYYFLNLYLFLSVYLFSIYSPLYINSMCTHTHG